MKYISTRNIFLDEYNITSCQVPPFSKLLNVLINSRELNLVFESPESSQAGMNNDKTFNFKIISGLIQQDTYIDERWKYFDTIRTQEGDVIDYYHIFFEEIKTLQETRDSKLQEIIDDEQDF
jgi:hypothetical protein